MSEELKKDEQAPEGQSNELSGGELDKVAGGLAIKSSDPDEGGDYTEPEKPVVPKTKAAFPR